MRRSVVRAMIAAGLLVGGCATRPVETVRTVPGGVAEVRARVEAELVRLGFSLAGSSTGTTLEATAGNVAAEWAACSPALVGGGDDRRQMAGAGPRRGSVRVDFVPMTGGTSVTVTPSFEASYRNGITGYSFERACRSNGVVEARLLTTAAS